MCAKKETVSIDRVKRAFADTQEPHIPPTYTLHQPTQDAYSTMHTSPSSTYVITTHSGWQVYWPKKLSKTVYKGNEHQTILLIGFLLTADLDQSYQVYFFSIGCKPKQGVM